MNPTVVPYYFHLLPMMNITREITLHSMVMNITREITLHSIVMTITREITLHSMVMNNKHCHINSAENAVFKLHYIV